MRCVCVRHALVLRWSCVGPALVMRWSCVGPALVMRWSCVGRALVVRWSCSLTSSRAGLDHGPQQPLDELDRQRQQGTDLRQNHDAYYGEVIDDHPHTTPCPRDEP